MGCPRIVLQQQGSRQRQAWGDSGGGGGGTSLTGRKQCQLAVPAIACTVQRPAAQE